MGENFLDRYPSELSGGEKQRLCIARALTLKPKILICDEAVAALDASTKKDILEMLKSLREQFGLSIIFISHDIDVIRHISDRIIHLDQGQIVSLSRPRQ
mgnify:CR=1 FL=1